MSSPRPPTSPLHPLRADLALVERGLVRSRTLARRLIEDGAVRLGEGHHDITVTRASQPVRPDQSLRVLDSDMARFVSRGGNKLDGVLQATGLDCRDLDALDVGMSTGGFTDCLLHHGVRQVLGIEVGHGQLDPRLQADPRVRCLEHTHIRDVRLASLQLPDGSSPRAGFALIVVDLSFIAASQLLSHLATLAAADAWLLCLIKPQFELGPDARNRQGIVRADADIEALRQAVFQRAGAAGWQPARWLPCALVGGDGNQEYFLVARRTGGTPALPPASRTP